MSADARDASASRSVADAHRLLLTRVPVRVRWRDLDAFQHVNNASFLTFLEEARLVWFSQLDGPWHTEEFMPVLAASHVNYRSQLGWPADVVVELYCERLGNSSMTIAHRIVAADDADVVYADGNAVVVWVDPAGKSMPLPPVIRDTCR
jgi:acyl-CoA thioester hydrolase